MTQTVKVEGIEAERGKPLREVLVDLYEEHRSMEPRVAGSNPAGRATSRWYRGLEVTRSPFSLP